jgi:hypothetical protein
MGACELLADLMAAGLTVTANGDRLEVRPASGLTEGLRHAVRAAKPELLALVARRSDDDRTATRLARLQRWAWPADEAQALAARLRLRDLHADHRHVCVECPHLIGSTARGWRCGNHRAAQVGRELPRELVGMFQDCPGFGETT